MRSVFLASAGMALAALGAVPAAAQSDSWTGPYVGGHLGYAFQPDDDDETVLFDTNLDGSFNDVVRTGAGADAFSTGFCGGNALQSRPTSGCADDDDGTDWAVHVGYDYQFGSLVGGLVAEYGRADITDDVSAFSTTPARYTLRRTLRDQYGLRARLGFAVGDTLVYATGGGARAKIRQRFTTSNAANTFTNNGDDNAWGFKAGGGIEQRFGNFSVGAQYLYSRFYTDEFIVRAQGPAPATNPFILVNPAGTDFARSDDEFDSHSAHVTASFRF